MKRWQVWYAWALLAVSIMAIAAGLWGIGTARGIDRATAAIGVVLGIWGVVVAILRRRTTR